MNASGRVINQEVKFTMKNIGCALLLLLVGCASFKSTDDIPAVKGFDEDSYYGEWYEIARLPDIYETQLTNVTFTYQPKGTRIELVKRGMRENRERTLTAIGKFEGPRDVAEFRLSFLYEFDARQRVLWVSEKYDRMIVAGDYFSNLWLLSRDREVPKSELDKMLKMCEDWGFDTSKLEYPQLPEQKQK